MSTLTLPSPAKINLFLRITSQRPDGYHNLQTLFQLLDFGDTLSFTSNSLEEIAIDSEIDGIATKDNLIFRAALILQQHVGTKHGCTIALNKKLPMGAGLGGGSSNAATTLVGLNSLWQCGVPLIELAKLGRKLGADVPVFVQGNSAFAEGIGELLTPMTLPEQWYLVITPECQVATGEIFSNPQLTRNSSPIKIRALSGEQYRNDCQKVVVSLYPAVEKALKWAENFAAPLMTGTGASVFCSFDNQAEADRALAELPEKWSAFVARGANRSSLHRQFGKLFTGAWPSG